MIQMLLGPAMELGKEFLKGKAEEKKAIQQRKINAIQNDADWENKMADATAKSWKDEWFAILISLPLLGVAYSVIVNDPAVIERVNQGFAALNNLPDWYQYLLFLVVSASFGIKSADKLMSMRKK
jgi:hypothetical protein|tara:strand:+ start:36 stop:410 length:375 start_codon:yes stop_codon:yes gene_type:complete